MKAFYSPGLKKQILNLSKTALGKNVKMLLVKMKQIAAHHKSFEHIDIHLFVCPSRKLRKRPGSSGFSRIGGETAPFPQGNKRSIESRDFVFDRRDLGDAYDVIYRAFALVHGVVLISYGRGHIYPAAVL